MFPAKKKGTKSKSDDERKENSTIPDFTPEPLRTRGSTISKIEGKLRLSKGFKLSAKKEKRKSKKTNELTDSKKKSSEFLNLMKLSKIETNKISQKEQEQAEIILKNIKTPRVVSFPLPRKMEMDCEKEEDDDDLLLSEEDLSLSDPSEFTDSLNSPAVIEGRINGISPILREEKLNTVNTPKEYEKSKYYSLHAKNLAISLINENDNISPIDIQKSNTPKKSTSEGVPFLNLKKLTPLKEYNGHESKSPNFLSPENSPRVAPTLKKFTKNEIAQRWQNMVMEQQIASEVRVAKQRLERNINYEKEIQHERNRQLKSDIMKPHQSVLMHNRINHQLQKLKDINSHSSHVTSNLMELTTLLSLFPEFKELSEQLNVEREKIFMTLEKIKLQSENLITSATYSISFSTHVPSVVWMRIFSYLDNESLKNCSLVCKEWKEMSFQFRKWES